MGCLTVLTGWTHRVTTKVRHSFTKTVEAGRCKIEWDNLFSNRDHFKADSGNMPLNDFCLISPTSHNPNQNDSGSVLQRNWWECTAPPELLLLYLTNQLFPSSQDALKSWIRANINWSVGVLIVSKWFHTLNKQPGKSNWLMKIQSRRIWGNENSSTSVYIEGRAAALMWTFGQNTVTAPAKQHRQ